MPSADSYAVRCSRSSRCSRSRSAAARAPRYSASSIECCWSRCRTRSLTSSSPSGRRLREPGSAASAASSIHRRRCTSRMPSTTAASSTSACGGAARRVSRVSPSPRRSATSRSATVCCKRSRSNRSSGGRCRRPIRNPAPRAPRCSRTNIGKGGSVATDRPSAARSRSIRTPSRSSGSCPRGFGSSIRRWT